uniref:Odorant-binding protein 9 n=1 Tax=Tropidothorax elegans TaxID=2233830 RepID=A0A2Z5EMJ3_9HEMI|nr:odorant-binding protein 9 [Tropidothorax elegans]
MEVIVMSVAMSVRWQKYNERFLRKVRGGVLAGGVSGTSPLSAMLSRGIVLVSLLAVLAGSLSPDEWDKVWNQSKKKCADLLMFNKTDPKSFPSIEEVPRTAKCFVSCFFDEVGLTNGTEINHALYTTWLEEELKHSNAKDSVIAAVRDCIDGIKKTEKCDTAYSLYECFGNK